MAVLLDAHVISARNHLGLRSCDFCPRVMNDEFVALRNVEHGEIQSELDFQYGWMAGGSPHKLKMLNEVIAYFPQLVRVKGLYPMGGLKRHGLNIAKAHENPIETDGSIIALDKLEHYWSPFRDNVGTQACRWHRHDATGCDSEHVFFASDVNVWANCEGVSFRDGGVFFRNPDEEIEGWFEMNESEKQRALVKFMVLGYQTLGMSGNVTNMVETALAVRRPRGKTWMDDPITVVGSSRMFVTMPLDRLTDEEFVNEYIERVKEDTAGTDLSINTYNDVLNSIGGAAGGILTEKMIMHLVENGDSVRISLPEVPARFQEMIGDREMTIWDQVRGHASGVPHVLAWTIFDMISRQNFRPPRAPVVLRGSGEDFIPTPSDTLFISKAMWKEK